MGDVLFPLPTDATDALAASLVRAVGYALYEYPLGSPELADAIRRITPAIENVLAAEYALPAVAEWLCDDIGYPI